MVIHPAIINEPFHDIFNPSIMIGLHEQNYREYGLVSYDYVTRGEMIPTYTFLDENIQKLAVKIDKSENLKEILLVLKVWDSEHFFGKIVETYGMPNTTSLSKFFLQKYGFNIPTSVKEDSLMNYYGNLPKPKINEFHELKNLVWYDINEKTKESQTDLIVKNRTDPSNKFSDKEIWVILKRAK